MLEYLLLDLFFFSFLLDFFSFITFSLILLCKVCFNAVLCMGFGTVFFTFTVVFSCCSVSLSLVSHFDLGLVGNFASNMFSILLQVSSVMGPCSGACFGVTFCFFAITGVALELDSLV